MMINFVVMSSDLWPHVLGTWVKRGRAINSSPPESFDHVPGEAGDIESECNMFCVSIVEVVC